MMMMMMTDRYVGALKAGKVTDVFLLLAVFQFGNKSLKQCRHDIRLRNPWIRKRMCYTLNIKALCIWWDNIVRRE